jgi:hypothetical protein
MIAEMTVARNGATKNQDWRASVLDDALRTASRDGSPEFTLIAALKRRFPESGVRRFCVADRQKTLALLEELTDGWEVICSPAWYDERDEDPLPVCGWWRALLPSGEAVEIALTPYSYGHGHWVLASTDSVGLQDLIETAMERLAVFTGRCLRFGEGGWTEAPEMAEEIDRIGWDDLVLDPALLSDLRRNIEAFFAQKETFRRLGFAWRRGVLLVGPPGTGKTMLCKAAASAHRDLPFLYVRDLRSNHDPIRAIFERARELAPCILAFEDLDGFLHDGNRTTFLNEMDGFKNNDGLLVIASSNHPHKIDEALLKRPSRFDRVYHVGLPALAERAEYGLRTLAKLSLPESLDIPALAALVAERTEGFTPAFLKEAYLSALLEIVHKGQEGDGPAFERAVLDQVELLRGYLKKAKNPDKLGDIAPSSSESVGFKGR